MEIRSRLHGLPIHGVVRWSNDNRFKLNSLKCKKLRKDFRRESNLDTVALKANGDAFEIVKSAKILGVTIRNDLIWNDHVDNNFYQHVSVTQVMQLVAASCDFQ